jgi:hypothetical protein
MHKSLLAAVVLVGCGVNTGTQVPPPATMQPPPAVNQQPLRCDMQEPPKTMASMLGSPRYMTLDEQSVYWLSGTTLYQAAKRGDTAPVKRVEGLQPISSLAAGAGAVYWVESASGKVFGLAPGSAQPVLVTDAVTRPSSLVVGPRGLYFIDTTVGAVKSVKLDGTGLISTLATGQRGPTQLKLDESSAYWVNVEGAKLAAYSVMKVSLDGGDPVSLMGEQSFAGGIALGRGHVYVATYDRLLRVGKDGTGLKVVLSEQSISGAPEADGDRVYWNAGGTALTTLDTVSAQVTKVATGSTVLDLAADASGVYWFSLPQSATQGELNRACE